MILSRIISVAFAMLVAIPLQAHAALSTFASFTSTSSVPDLTFVADGTGPGGSLFTSTPGAGNSLTSPASVNVSFHFLDDQLSNLGLISSSFVLAATTSAPATSLPSSLFSQPNFNGYFEFLYTGTTNLQVNGVTYSTGAVLLRGDFTNVSLLGVRNGTSGGLYGSTEDTPASAITYSSQLLDLSSTGSKDLALSLTSATPRFTIPNADLSGFSAVTTGSFSAAPPSVPEPGTWMMMIAGFGLIGFSIRGARGNVFGALTTMPEPCASSDRSIHA